MRKYLSLTRVLLKNSMGMMSDGKSKKALNVFIYGVLAVCMIPLGFTLYMMFNTAMAQLQPLQQEGAVLALGFHISSLVTFLFSIFLIPSIFYFSKDSETLLALPLPPQTILSAKFSVCLVYEYAFTLIVCVPLYIYSTCAGNFHYPSNLSPRPVQHHHDAADAFCAVFQKPRPLQYDCRYPFHYSGLRLQLCNELRYDCRGSQCAHFDADTGE